MNLTDLPNELFKKVTQYLNHKDYMSLYCCSKLLYSKRAPYKFQPPTQNLERFLRKAPMEAMEALLITNWTENLIVLAFVRGLPACDKLIKSHQITDQLYKMHSTDIPENVRRAYNFSKDLSFTLPSICAIFGHTHLIELLLDRGFDIRKSNQYEVTPLGCAIVQNHSDTCRLLVQRGANLNDVGRRAAAIHLAAKCSTPEILEILVSAGEDVNFLHRGETPLLKAVESGNIENTRWLLDYGADLFPVDADDPPVLHKSMQNEDPTIFDFVLQKYLESDPPEYWKEDALLYAVSLEHFDACKKLLEIGANVNGNPTYSDTPLTFCLSGFSFGEFQQDIFDLLMEHGADLFVGNPSKESALKMATASNLIDVMERLIEKEPKIVVWSCREGVYGALHTAASHGNVRACQLLVVHGADVNVRDQHGKTPLMLSADRSSEDFTRFLLESVVDMNIRDN